LTCVPVHKSAEPGSLAVRIDLDQRAGLLAEAPETYYVTDHYRSHPIVLVRMSQIQTGQLRDLLSAAWHFVTSRASRSTATGGRKTAKRRVKKPPRT